jgi:hypothetical protein
MKQEREELTAPDIPKPKSLDIKECCWVYREIKLGTPKSKLAVYFNITMTEIEMVEDIGKQLKW